MGSHIADYFQSYFPNAEIFGLRRWHLSITRNINHLAEKIVLLDCDLTDPVATEDVIRRVRPEIVFHCAAQSFVSPSWRHPSLYMDVNYKGTVNLLEAIRKHSPETFIHLPGSGEEYGKIAQDMLPINSQTAINPVNPYAVSKVAQDLIGLVYYESYGVNVIRTRAFNHEGPRRMNVFGLPWYAYQLARISHSIQEPLLTTGETSDLRNFTHVLDMVEAYVKAVQFCDPGKLYLIGNSLSTHELTFRDCIDRMIRYAGLDGRVEIKQVSQYTRPTSVPYLIADVSEFVSVTGWSINKSMDDVLNDTVDYWMHNFMCFPRWNVLSEVAPI